MLKRWETFLARREERRALLDAGAALPASPAIAAIDEKLRALDGMLALSLARDRADYAAVPAWAKWLVVCRGVCDRAVVRALRHRARRDRDEACIALGAASSDEPLRRAREHREKLE